MADKSIDELNAASELDDTDLLAVFQDGETKKMAGAVLRDYVDDIIDPAVDAATDAKEAAESAKSSAIDYALAASNSANAASGSASAASTSASDADISAKNSQAYATGYRGNTPVTQGDDAYHNNASYYAGQASSSASEASSSASQAGFSEVMAKAWATGAGTAAPGGGTTPGTENNAMYYAGQAGLSATSAETDALKAEGYAVGTQDGVEQQSGTYYHNNAAYYSDRADTDALKAEGYAAGTQDGTPVSSGTYFENNAAYYNTQAGGSASSASDSADAASASATSAGTNALIAEGYAVGKQNGTSQQSGTYYHNNAAYYNTQAGTSASTAASKASDAEAWAVGKRGGQIVPSDPDPNIPSSTNNSLYWAAKAIDTAQRVTADAVAAWLEDNPNALSDAVVQEKLTKYATAADMQDDVSLVAGEIVATYGFTARGDGGACSYYISNTEVAGEYNVLLDNGKYAVMITNGNYVTPEMFGAKGDGVMDDTVPFYAAFDKAIEQNKILRLTPKKKYLIYEASGHLRQNRRLDIVIDGNNATLKRPNLSEDPYNCTRSEIDSSRFFRFRTPNRESTVVFRNVIFDGSAFEIGWQPDGTTSNDYKWEQAAFVSTLGSASNKLNIIFDGCSFINNFSSGCSVTNYVNARFINCVTRNCLKGMVSFVGYGSDVFISDSNIYCDDQYASTCIPICVEITTGSSPFSTSAQSNLYVNNVYMEGPVKFTTMTGLGRTVASNIIARKVSRFTVQTQSDAFISNSSFEFFKVPDGIANTEEFDLASTGSSYSGHRKISYINCSFFATGDYYPILRSDMRDVSDSELDFTCCNFSHLARALSVDMGNSRKDVHFTDCYFKDISDFVVGPSALNDYRNVALREVIFDKCVFDIQDTAYITRSAYQDNNHKVTRAPKYVFTNSKTLSVNAGLNCAGNAVDSFVFRDDIWDYGTNVTVEDTSGSFLPAVFGKRFRYVTEVPTDTGFNDCDIAFVTSGGATQKYIYKNNAWVLEPATVGDIPPTLSASDAGFQFFNTTMGKPIYWTGTAWVYADGTALS